MKQPILHCETIGHGEDGLLKFKIMFEQYLENPLDKRNIVLPKDFVFNGGNIPRGFRNAMNPTGKVFNPSAVHDFGLEKTGFLYYVDGELTFEHVKRSYVHKLFIAMLKEYKVHWIIRPIAYLGVKLFGKGNY